jgi:hypothetical protein
MLSPATISATRLMELLAPTLGWEKSSEVVSVALSRRALSHGDIAIEDALSLLDELAQRAGMVGIAARYASTRLSAQRATTDAPPPPSGGAPSSGVLPASSRSRPLAVDMKDIAALFSSALGRGQSEEVLSAAARKLGLPGDRLDKAQAMTLVDHLASEPGAVGLCARFAKARLILRFAA